MTDELELIPDPDDVRVWDNLRRIREWAAATTEGVNFAQQFLLMGA